MTAVVISAAIIMAVAVAVAIIAVSSSERCPGKTHWTGQDVIVFIVGLPPVEHATVESSLSAFFVLLRW